MMLLILFGLLTIVAVLGYGLISLVKQSSPPQRLLKALTLRVVLSILLFISLMLANYLGFIQPYQWLH